MMQVPEHIVALIEKYLEGKATPSEKDELNNWYHSFNDEETEVLLNPEDSGEALEQRLKMRLLQTIRKKDKKTAAPHRRKWMVAAAAILLIMLSAGSYYLFIKNDNEQPLVRNKPVPQLNDIAPGGNKALLTLADGTTIVLDSAANGTLTSQGNIQVKKLHNGQIAYIINGQQVTENDEAFYNTISTPRGGQYQVTLADGTKVWLNAASSIRFPVVFTGTERKVEMTGEAYFEVFKNKANPFKVKAAGSEVAVLGTYFNVNAYTDESAIRTTLLEGSVKVSVPGITKTGAEKYLTPGQQSAVLVNGMIDVLNDADTEEAVAWKNGRFQFHSADLKSILRQIARWYDVEVVYNGNVNLHFTGQLTRNGNVSKVFEKLALTGEVQFAIEGKKIIVSPSKQPK